MKIISKNVSIKIKNFSKSWKFRAKSGKFQSYWIQNKLYFSLNFTANEGTNLFDKQQNRKFRVIFERTPRFEHKLYFSLGEKIISPNSSGI